MVTAPASPPPPDICDRCERRVIRDSQGRWVHAEVADAVFCGLVMRAGERRGVTG